MASDETTTDQPATAGTSGDEQVTKPKRSRRRATSGTVTPPPAGPSGAPAASVPTESAASSTAEPSSTAAPAEKPAAKAAKKTPKKAAKKAAKKATAPTDPVEGDAGAAAGPATEPEKPKRTRRASKKTAASPAFEPGAADDGAQDAPSADAAQDAPPTGAGGTLGLVFQAPDPANAPKRRRASAPAQAPAERSADDAPRDDGQDGRAGAAQQDTAAEAELPDAGGEDAAADGDDEEQSGSARRRRRRGGRGRRGRGGSGDDGGSDGEGEEQSGSGRGEKDAGGSGTSAERSGSDADAEDGESTSSRRRRRRRRSGSSDDGDNPPGTVTKVRSPRKDREEPQAVKGSTRLEAKKQRRREGREAGRRRTIITEAEFLARRESVDRVMVVRGVGDRTQIGVLEDGVLVEHYVSRETTASMAGNVYLGRVQNVLPSMEAAFVDIGKGRNAVLYAGEVNWDAAGLETNAPKRIENALSSGDTVLVQVTKDPIGHKGARLTSQISLPGRFLVYVPEGSMTGISRKLPDTERSRLKAILKEVVPDTAGVIVRTAAEGASEEELRADVERLSKTWEAIAKQARSAASKKASAGGAPVLLHGEPDLTVRVIRDVFTEDFASLVVAGERAWTQVNGYVSDVAPDLADRVTRWTSEEDVFGHYRIDEQLAKAMDRKVWLPSGGSLVIDRTEAMTVIDVNTGKFVGSGGNLEETVTKNNIEAAEEIVRQLRLRDVGGIIVIDFIDMVLESNRELVVRRLLECLGRDRTKHQVAEVTSLGLVQMTRKRVGSGLIEVFSEPCDHCSGRGIVVHSEPVTRGGSGDGGSGGGSGSSRSSRPGRSTRGRAATEEPAEERTPNGPTPAQIAAAAHAAAIKGVAGEPTEDDVADLVVPVGQDQEPQAVEQTEAPPVRTRRKRGRVVAPAGPPKAEEGQPAPDQAEEGEPEPDRAEERPVGQDDPPADLAGDSPDR